MNELLSVISATLVVSSGSLVGILLLSQSRDLLTKIQLALVSLSAGTMLGAAFLHLLPESVELLPGPLPFQIVLLSFVAFFILERVLHWRHCHSPEHLQKHTLGIMNLLGDGVHNFLDGLLIAASFAAGEGLGIAAALAIILHEVPQEIGDYGVLLHSGFSRRRALIMNILVSLTAVLGGVAGYFATHSIDALASYLIPIAAGGFLYIGAADLLPELKSESSPRKMLTTVLVFLLGVVLMLLVKD